MRSGTGFWASWPAAGSHRKRRCACFKANSGIAIGPGRRLNVEIVSQDVGTTPKVRLVAIGGDLRLTGREGTTLEAQAPPRGDLEVRSVAGTIEVSSRAACLIFLPEGTQVSGDAVGGDVRIAGLRGDLKLGTVGGDLSLRRVGRCEIGRAAGNLAV